MNSDSKDGRPDQGEHRTQTRDADGRGQTESDAERGALFSKLERGLARLRAEPDAADDILECLAPVLASASKEWRDIFQGFADVRGRRHALKRVALEQFMDDLRSGRTRLGANLEASGDDPSQVETDTSAMSPAGLEGHLRTVTHDSMDELADRYQRDGYERLPLGQRTEVSASGDTSVEVMVSNVTLKLRSGRPAICEVVGGRAYILKEGENFIGRAPFNDIVLDPGQVGISRRHLIVEVRNGRVISLTDLSSGGTFVTPRGLRHS